MIVILFMLELFVFVFLYVLFFFFFFQAEDGIRDADVTGVQTCALPISPSFSCGTNTEPKRDARIRLSTTNAPAEIRTVQRLFKAVSKRGLYRFLAATMAVLSFSLILPVNSMATAAGTNVMENSMAANKAIMTVAAIG